eukprot:m.314746 g.314746  ORF g.314746 m.314746 type:complete len:151 (-) comp23063_c2_seq1:279-731(-)
MGSRDAKATIACLREQLKEQNNQCQQLKQKMIDAGLVDGSELGLGRLSEAELKRRLGSLDTKAKACENDIEKLNNAILAARTKLKEKRAEQDSIAARYNECRGALNKRILGRIKKFAGDIVDGNGAPDKRVAEQLSMISAAIGDDAIDLR